MPLRREVRDLGRRWPSLVERAMAYARVIPCEGVSSVAFERAVLFDVDPLATGAIVETLHAQRVLWRRRNRGAVRIFAGRPERISGLFEAPDQIEKTLSAVAPLVYRIARSLKARDEAKRSKDFVAAQEARGRLSTALGRLAAILQSRDSQGAISEAMKTVFPADVMEALSAFEMMTPVDCEGRSSRRIAPGLSPEAKVHAIVAKSATLGITKSGIYQAIRPKIAASELGSILDGLAEQGKIEAKRGRKALRFFAGRGI